MLEPTDESHDDVIEECDVYLSEPSTSGEDVGSVSLLQYPIWGSGREEPALQQAKFKPRQRRFEVVLSYDTNDPSYDRGKAADLSSKAGQTNRSINTITYSNKNAVGLHNAAYGLGTFVEGKFVIIPVNEIIQLKPNMSQIEEVSRTVEETVSQAGPSQVTVQFAREETEASRKRRLESYQHQQSIWQEESWQKLSLYERSSSEVARLMELLTLGTGRSGMAEPRFNLTEKEMLEALAPPPPEGEEENTTSGGLLCLASIQDLPLAEQIRALLCRVKVMRFKQLLDLLPPKMDETSVLNQLHQFALLVRGCWVVKSELIYPRDTISPHSGISADLLCRARNYVCLCFTKRSPPNDIPVKREEIIRDSGKIPDEDILEILRGVAKYYVGKGWYFKYLPDTDFISNYSWVVERQKAVWVGIENQLNLPPPPEPVEPRRRRTSSTAGKSERGAERKRRRTGSKSQSDSDQGFTSDPEQMGNMKPPRRRRTSSKTGFPPVAVPSPLASNNQIHNNNAMAVGKSATVGNSSTVGKSATVGKLAVGATATVGNSTPPVLAATPVVVNSAGFPRLKNDVFDEIRRKLHVKFSTKGILKHADLIAEIRTCQSAVTDALRTQNANKVLAELIADVGAAPSLPLTQQLKTQVFVLSETDDWPLVRLLIIRLLEASQGKAIKFQTFKKACRGNLQQFPNDEELRRILGMYCTQADGDGNLYVVA